jgi:hypothetical protein
MSFRTFSPPASAAHKRVHDGWRAWGLGAALGAAAQLLFVGDYITWFLGALCHEMGHTAVAILTGSPSFPAIRLDGHAATQIADRQLWLAILVLGVVGAWCVAARRDRALLTFRAACLIPLVIAALVPTAREVLILYAGQFGELLFAGIFLFRAYTGGFTDQPAERPLYAALGWIFVWENLVLAAGLILSDAARAAYRGGGSFGGENDLVRIARDQLGCSLPAAAVPLLLASIAMPLLVWWLGSVVRDDTGEAHA